LDPEYSSEARSLEDLCPVCGRPFGFPLFDAPTEIGTFKVVRGLNRGFYSAVFHVTQGALEAPYVLKVASKIIYEKFDGKDFEQECRLHRDVAEGSDHLVPIRDMFDADIVFGDVTIPCDVAQLDYLPGEVLEDVLVADPPPSARTIAQIALDLLQLLEELQAKEVFHNDLHDGNVIVQRLSASSRRAEALDDSVRAVAIDLGSITDASKSDSARLGDLRSVARHLETFANRLLVRPGEASDLDTRLAGQLQEIAALLSSEAVNQRPPEFAVLRERIRQAHDFVSSPWKEPPPLRSIDDSYNAQTLHPWFVPKLLVDPDERWRDAISVQGPQVITGMRGCGKTMLLRSLMFHARAAAHQDSLSGEALAQALADDGYVGLYVSCNRLLDPLGAADQLHEPDARLFVAYVREALRAIRHLREIDRGLPAVGAARGIGVVLDDYIANASTLVDTDDELVLERLALRMLASLQRGESDHVLRADPSAAFVALAEAVKNASPMWSAASVFFLLDDVSTRHLDAESIRALVSRLIFSSDICAFKMTTEEQTLEYVLMSPGLIEKARPGRDYEVFEFGARVYERIRAPLRDGGGTNFIKDILALRAAQYPGHPDNVTPAQLLGDERLETIAQQIATLSATAAERKRIYHGLRALTAVCVGDIGDVLAIYDAMFRRAGAERIPIPPDLQHRCFQDYCAQRLYHINHRDGRFKDAALGFAQAARDLLVASAKGDGRLRQYSSVYVRVTTDDSDEQFDQLRTLIDAGVFVLEGGAPRTKTRDDDPVQQFILKYRKLFGLASYIGLSDRDRFELSGDDLREWLAEPKRGKDILMRNLGGPLDDAETEEPPLGDTSPEPEDTGAMRAQTLFEAVDEQPADMAEAERRVVLASSRAPTATELTREDLRGADLRSVVLGLGFEERTLASARRLLDTVQPQQAVLIRYDEAGYADEIERIVRERVGLVEILDYRGLGAAADALPPPGPCLVDVTGLAKPMIFQTVRRALSREGHVFVAHAQAQRHYPLDEAIQPVLAAEHNGDVWALLEGLDDVWLGEAGPYSFEQLLLTDADESRRRHLIASASPKHQRLLSLVEQRDFDRIQILAPTGESPRDELARRAADVATRLAESPEVSRVDSDDLEGALREITQAHQRYYVDGNYNFELGLTGSKLHAVAFAAISASMMISQAWYVRPSVFDPARFSIGTGASRYFKLSAPVLD
jgi:hypothetical protein